MKVSKNVLKCFSVIWKTLSSEFYNATRVNFFRKFLEESVKNIYINLDVNEVPRCCGARLISGFDAMTFVIEKGDKCVDFAKTLGYPVGSTFRPEATFQKGLFGENDKIQEVIHGNLFEKMKMLYERGFKVVFVATTTEQTNTNIVLNNQGFYTMNPYNRIIGWMVTLSEWAKHNGVV
jgi:hypothetical protein